MPKVGVVLPAFNAGPYLLEAVQSILDQSFIDFSLFVIDDGSTDASIDSISRLSDHRLHLIKNDSNRGLIFSLNRGIEHARDCQYIARMDADDISHPLRFAQQIDYLDRNPRVGVLGAGMRYFGKNVFSRNWINPASHELIYAALFGKNPIAHPTVMLRTDCLPLNPYDSNYPKYEDYALWIDLIGQCEFANLSTVLLKYRRHNSNITSTYNSNIANDINTFTRILRKLADKTGSEISDEDIDILAAITSSARALHMSPFSIERIGNSVNCLIKNIDCGTNAKDYISDFFYGRILRYGLTTKHPYQAIKLITQNTPLRIASIASIQLSGT